MRTKIAVKRLLALTVVFISVNMLLFSRLAQNSIDSIRPFFDRISENFYSSVKAIPDASAEYIYNNSKPLQLTETETVFVSADEGDNLPIFENNTTADVPQDESTEVSSVDVGKTGSDGVVFYPLIEKDLSAKEPYLLTNQTNYSVDTGKIAGTVPCSLENLSLSDGPLVLIVHTHATECYSQSSGDSYNFSEPTRSDDISQNVVSIGSRIATSLEDFGIGVLHDKTLHDKTSFINAYSHSYSAVKKYLEEYPSIKFVLDIHRDAITDAQNQKTKPVTTIAGQKYAQIMFVVGTDQSKKNHPNWKQNLSLAFALENKLNEMYPSICRKTNLRSASFNQELSDGYLLVEIGSHGNTLSEALGSADAFAYALSSLITDSIQT